MLLPLWLCCTEKQDTLLIVVWKCGAALSWHQFLNCSLACSQARNLSIVRKFLLQSWKVRQSTDLVKKDITQQTCSKKGAKRELQNSIGDKSKGKYASSSSSTKISYPQIIFIYVFKTSETCMKPLSWIVSTLLKSLIVALKYSQPMRNFFFFFFRACVCFKS